LSLVSLSQAFLFSAAYGIVLFLDIQEGFGYAGKAEKVDSGNVEARFVIPESTHCTLRSCVFVTGQRNVLTSVRQDRLFRRVLLHALIRWHDMESGARPPLACTVALLRIRNRSSQFAATCTTRTSGEPNLILGHVSSASPVNKITM